MIQAYSNPILPKSKKVSKEKRTTNLLETIDGVEYEHPVTPGPQSVFS